MTVIVCGAGAAGLMAAGTAAKYADRVILIEKNDRVGRKLRITGKGRCNITNSRDVAEMIDMYPTNGKFLYSALYTFTNDDMVSLLEEHGVKTKVERGGRIFPVSDDARDVVAAMRRYAMRDNVKLVRAKVKAIIIENGAVMGVNTSAGRFLGDRVIVCTGGASYPQTGSDGSGYELARQAGHTVTDITPSLVPLTVEEDICRDLSGLSLRNVKTTAYGKRGKKLYEGFGEMLFTHFGVSGPLILSMSAHIRKEAAKGCTLEIDLKPALAPEKLDARILRDLEANNRKHLINSLDALLPKALIPVVIENAGIEPHKPAAEVTKAERLRLGEAIKRFILHITGLRPVEEAIVTSGGVKTSEIDPSTMESKLVKGLYFAGEIIDIDGYTGGYNLQAAWSTGYLAGINAGGGI